MKPIRHIIITLSLVLNVGSQKFQQEQFPFPPHFQTPGSPIFSSDSTIYLPPESSTPVPYFQTNNINKYPVKFLPPTAVKAPSIYPTPYPMLSSTLRSNFEDESNNFKDITRLRSSSSPNTVQTNRNINNTENNISQQTERDMRTIRRVPNFQQKNENLNHFENMEQKKFQYPAGTIPTQNAPNQNPASRRMIVTSEIQRNENAMDQVKSASFANAQYIQAPGIIIASTTEPAIPILRLSNEMDLDGSFSYEALGADQTHYVQHSRMENTGTDKEEQVVEGSYSYVGDNGQTYTVHYVADSNGYRASGDHLPVAPPIPEIIQRAIQYNLAEEARKPPHLKETWDSQSKDYDNDETSNRYTITSLRNLFTGRTPEAFSLGYSQGSQNNLVLAASTNVPVKTSYEISNDQFKTKSNTPIAPQVTFLASQGAHNPSSQPQQVSARIVSTEKSPLPQLVNYEAGAKESDPEVNKGLWRWQYGLAPNDNSNPSKNTISRSSGEGDDVIINFNDMTPDQYTTMIQTQISDQQSADTTKIIDIPKNYDDFKRVELNYQENVGVNVNNNSDEKIKIQNDYDNFEIQDTNKSHIKETAPTSTENSISSTIEINSNPQNIENKNFYHFNNQEDIDNTKTDIYSQIISRQNFVPKSSIVTQTYNFEDMTNDIPVVDILKENAGHVKTKLSDAKIVYSDTMQPAYSNNWINSLNEGISSTILPVISSTDVTLKSIELEPDKSDFKPVTTVENYYEKNSSPTTTDSVTISNDQMIRENIFLKNLLKPKANEFKTASKYSTSQRDTYFPDNYKPKEEKVAKILQYQPSPHNEIKLSNKKPFDINDVLNYVTLKNHFESSKTRPKNIESINFSQNINQKEVRPVRYIPTHDYVKDGETNNKEDNDDTYRVKYNQQKQLHGIIKNYKVLQRQRNAGQSDNHFSPEISHRNIKTFHNLGLPPLGRAGPSLKSYLPPTFA